MPVFSGVTIAEHNSRESTQPLEVHKGVLGVGGLGGLYPAVRHYATCHHNGSTYDHGEAVSDFHCFRSKNRLWNCINWFYFKMSLHLWQ